MEQMTGASRVSVGRPEGRGPLAIPKQCDIGMEWIDLAQDMNKLPAVVKAVFLNFWEIPD
jgi:hypothetical protein